MDGANVNEKFQKLLVNADVLTNINKLFLDTWIFLQRSCSLNFNLDQYEFDINVFCKLSAG